MSYGRLESGFCCSCGRDKTPVWQYKAGVGTSETQHAHCDLCWKSFLGAACVNPSAYPKTDRALLASVAWWIVDTLGER